MKNKGEKSYLYEKQYGLDLKKKKKQIEITKLKRMKMDDEMMAMDDIFFSALTIMLKIERNIKIALKDTTKF